jgi:hypothetical protein
MEENSCRAKEYLFIATGIVNKNQHKHGELYP